MKARPAKMKRLSKFLILWLPPVVWAAVIFTFSSFSSIATSQIFWQDFIVKKSAHIIEYAIFAVLLFRSLKASGFQVKGAGFFALVIAFLYAITDELHQSFTPGREPRFRDIIFDTIGATFAVYFIWNLLPKAPARLKNLAKKLQLI